MHIGLEVYIASDIPDYNAYAHWLEANRKLIHGRNTSPFSLQVGKTNKQPTNTEYYEKLRQPYRRETLHVWLYSDACIMVCCRFRQKVSKESFRTPFPPPYPHSFFVEKLRKTTTLSRLSIRPIAVWRLAPPTNIRIAGRRLSLPRYSVI